MFSSESERDRIREEGREDDRECEERRKVRGRRTGVDKQ